MSDISLSIEETNKLRISLGLKPIPVDVSEPTTEPTETVIIPKKENHLKERLQEAQDKAARKRKASGKTLNDLDEVDTDSWLRNLGTKKQTTKKQKTEEVSSVHAIKIGHSSRHMESISGDVLTLKDTDIYDDEDQLYNDTILRQEKVKNTLKEKAAADSIKFNGRSYRKFDEDDEDSQDENLFSGEVIKVAKEPPKEVQLGQVQVSKLFDEDEEITTLSDFSKPVKMKKIKKKTKEKANETKKTVEPSEMISVELAHFEDDTEEDLQRILALKRRAKQKERSFLTAEQIADEVLAYKRLDIENQIEKGSGMVFDDTNEFLSSLRGDILDVPLAVEEIQEIESNGKVLETSIDTHDVDENKDKNDNSITTPDERTSTAINDSGNVTFNGGLASTLQFLQSRNIIEKPTQELMEQNKNRREASRNAELLKLKISIEERLLREELESDKKYILLPKQEKIVFFERILDQRLREKKIVTEPERKKYKQEYNPLVKISYRDDSGAELNTKQAFKYLSHQFHGVGPGNNKIDKNLKKRKEAGKSNLDGKVV